MAPVYPVPPARALTFNQGTFNKVYPTKTNATSVPEPPAVLYLANTVSGTTIPNSGWSSGDLTLVNCTVLEQDFDNGQYVYLPGTASNYVSTPDAPALDIIGDFEIRCTVQLDDWNTGVQNLVAKRESFRLIQNTTKLQIRMYDGISETGHIWSGAHGLADGEIADIVATFNLATDTVVITVNGTEVVLGTTGTLSAVNNSTYSLTLGTQTGTAEMAKGKFYSASLYDSDSDGSLVASFDAADLDQTSGTWTILDPYVYLPGTTGNYISTPDSAALDITGDLDLRAHVAMDTWTPGSTSAWIAKYLGSGGSDSFIFALDGGTNKPKLWWSEDGTVLKSATADFAPTVADGDKLWIRATLDVNNGAGSHNVKFYTSSDGVSWNQLGATVADSGGGVTSIFAGTQNVSLMGYATGAGALSKGKIYAAEVRNGIDGTIVASFDSADADEHGDTSWISSATGETWTINGGESATTEQTYTINRSSTGFKSAVVSETLILFNGTDSYGHTADRADLDFGASDDLTAIWAGRVWGTPGSSNEGLICKKLSTADSNAGWAVYTDSVYRVVAMIGDATVAPFAFVGAGTFGQTSVGLLRRNTTADTVASKRNNEAEVTTTDTTTATLANALDVEVGRLSTNYTDMEFRGAAVYRRSVPDSLADSYVIQYGGGT